MNQAPIHPTHGPHVGPFLRAVGRLLLGVMGWRIEGEEPPHPKYICAIAPHTSNWDLYFLLSASWVSGIRGTWLMKHTWFFFPLGVLWRALGGLPVNRGKAANLVEEVVAAFNERDQMILVITPEGTRKKKEYWKSGFYRIAYEAQVPIVLCYGDYERKRCGFGPIVHVTGDVEADMARMAAFFDAVKPKCPENVTPPRLRPEVGEQLRRLDKEAS